MFQFSQQLLPLLHFFSDSPMHSVALETKGWHGMVGSTEFRLFQVSYGMDAILGGDNAARSNFDHVIPSSRNNI